MDLIYTDAERVDVGVLHGYVMDIAYGVEENNFELDLPMDMETLPEEDAFIYFDGTEYGGIIDSIQSDTENKRVIYAGRSWHGILEGKVIEPDKGDDTLLLNGDAHDVLRSLIDRMNLTGIFSVSEEKSGIEIVSYEINYDYGYTGIRKMLFSFDAKLKMEMKNGYVLLYVEPIRDYSQDEEFDSSQIDYSLKKTYNITNHVVCRGTDTGEDYVNIYVIHIFTDANGGIQPYATDEMPIKDSQYILDKSKQVVNGAAEITTFIDETSVSAVENYEAVNSQPDDWVSTFENYYVYDEEKDSYDAVEVKKQNVYSITTSKPSDWGDRYANYYKYENNNYSSVEGVETVSYKELKKMPSKWKTNYGDYFYFYTDGVHSEYKSVEGVRHYKYEKQTQKPTDWENNYTSYYRKATAKELKSNGKKQYYSVTADEKKVTTTRKDKNGKIIRETKTISSTPKWSAKKYYTQESYETAPKFSNNTYFSEVTLTSAPEWKTNTYYKLLEDQIIVPAFCSGKYYRKVLDHYAKLVEKAVEELRKEAEECDEISIDLDATEAEYDIGDIVGAYEPITGIEVFQPITKKIIKLEEDSIPMISYEVGVNGSE